MDFQKDNFVSWKMLGEPQQPGDFIIPKGIVKVSEKDIEESKNCPMALCPDLKVSLIYISPSRGDIGNGYYLIGFFDSEQYQKEGAIEKMDPSVAKIQKLQRGLNEL